MTQYEPDSLAKYLKGCVIVYDKQEMNGKHQVGSGRAVTVTHDTPFIKGTVPQNDPGVNPNSETGSGLNGNDGILLQDRRKWKPGNAKCIHPPISGQEAPEPISHERINPSMHQKPETGIPWRWAGYRYCRENVHIPIVIPASVDKRLKIV